MALPKITGPSGSAGDSISSISINENTRTIHNFSSDKSVIWSISGGLDQSLFSINSSNGYLSFNSAPNFESPSDSNADNRYIVDVRATTSSGFISDQTVIISVNDVVDTVPIVPNSLTVNQNFGSSSNDIISTNWDELVWGLDGDDTFILPNYNNADHPEPFLIGGNGNDTYTINKDQGAVIYEAPNQGNNDRLVLNGLSFNSPYSYYIFIDSDHLLFGNFSNNQFVFVLDALDSLNYPYQSGIDSIQLDDALYDAKTLIRSLYYDRYYYGGYLGSYSFSYLDQLVGGLASQEGWTSSNFRSLISEIDNNEANFIPDTIDIWNYLASNTDLIDVIGSDTNAALSHYLSNGEKEKRAADSFDEWAYLASNTDLIDVIGSDTNAATQHYVTNGYSEGRNTSSFNAYNYLLNYSDLSIFYNDLFLATKHYVNYGYEEGRSDSSISNDESSNITDLAYFYIASNNDLISAFGIDIEAAKSHYTNHGKSEGRSITTFSTANYLSNYDDLSSAFRDDKTKALKHYIQYGYKEGRTDFSTVSNLTYFQALNYVASYNDLISAFGIDIEAARSHYTNHGKSEGRSITSFNTSNYLSNYTDLSSSLGNDELLALKHYIQYGHKEGRTDSYIDSNSSSGSDSNSGGLSNLTDLEAYNYIASNNDLISAFGTDIAAAKSHYTNHGKAEGRPLDNFDEWGYLASNKDLLNAFGKDATKAIKHYISYGKSEGRLTNLFNAESYLNSNSDLRNAFGNDLDAAKKHFVEHGFNEGEYFKKSYIVKFLFCL